MEKDSEKQIFFNKTKGQSAIEYLMTYGWMLLVVAIVGGAILSTVTGQCLNEADMLDNNIEATDFAASDGNLQIEFENLARDNLEIQEIVIRDNGNEFVKNQTSISENSGQTIGARAEKIFDLTEAGDEDDEISVSVSETCNEYDLEIQYQRGEFNPETAPGTLQDNLEIR